MKAIVKKILVNTMPPLFMAPYYKIQKHLQKKRASRKLENHSRLHLACGWNILKNWANVDILNAPNVIRWNLASPLPVKENSIEYILCEHYIEHIDREQAKAFMLDYYRALKKGGVLRISTPSLRKIIEDYSKGGIPDGETDRTVVTPCQILNKYLHWWGHEFVYDEEEMDLLFSDAGFRENKKVPWRKSDHVDLNGLEFRPDNDDNIFEGTK